MLYEPTITGLEHSDKTSIEVQMIKHFSVIHNYSCNLYYYKNMNNWVALQVEKSDLLFNYKSIIWILFSMQNI